MGLLSRQPAEVPRPSPVADGVEFEETFGDDSVTDTPEPTTQAAPRLTLVRSVAPAADEHLVERIEAMLLEWQARFEARLDQRRIDEERLAERRRRSDDERLRAWRTEIEHQLLQRSPARDSEPARGRGPELRESAVREAQHDTRDDPAVRAIADARSARDVGRVLRDFLSQLTRTSAFALSLHHAERNEVAYRYRVASEDELGALLRRDALDDGPDSGVARMDGWVRSHRSVPVAGRSVVVHTAQCAVRDGEATVGVLTLQTAGDPVPERALARVAALTAVTASRLAELRESGAFRGA